MLDKLEIDRINNVAQVNIKNSQDYLEARKKAARAKYTLDVIIAKAYKDKTVDPKMAYEKAQVVIGNMSPENQATYKEMSDSVAHFKGLERVIDANQSQIMLAQSIMRNYKDNG